MSNKDEWTAGNILWQDLTVSNVIEVRDFYREIIGWNCISEDMGGYDDFHMVIPPSGNIVLLGYATPAERKLIYHLYG